jgi:RsiW-degrading membrane proteinase PrsW (M82 family)
LPINGDEVSHFEELRDAYRRLYDSGLIDDEEYERQMARLVVRERVSAVEQGGIATVFRVDRHTARRIVSSQVFWVVLALALMPLLMAAVGLPRDQGLIVYFALLWFLLFRHLFRLNLRGSLPGDFALVAALVVVPGMVAVLPSLMVALAPLYRLINAPQLLLRWVGFFAGVGIAEELTKGLPTLVTLWLVRRSGRRPSLQAVLLLGVTSGLVFAGLENILYSEQFGTRLWGMAFTRQDVVLARLLMTPFLHAVWSGSLAFAIGVAAATGSLSPGRLVRVAGPVLVLVAALHGTYNTVAFVPALAVAVGGLSYLVLVVAVVVAKRWEGASAAFLDERVL